MSIELKSHNQEAYSKVKQAFEASTRTAVIHPTGTGKSYIAMKLIEENPDKKVIYLSPSLGILLQLITPSGQTIKMTYQTLARLSDEEIKKLGVDIIVLDEFHHCGAPIWGEAVQKLTNTFPNARVLGLSATPIRYFDGNIDMAEELFGNNIASEISFEEAVEQGILPEFDYVSALYSSEESLKNLKDRIDSASVVISKKQEAHRLYNELKSQIEKNVENLPDILKEHIPNPNGKYIIFCRNIEDMESKIEEVRKLFEQVNTKIEVNSVSSYETQHKNERSIKQFTDNKNPETLKLMFAVNMLNEGFHLPDIDGVIMMRPTMSPTIFQQQMGRALSVGNNGKRPVVIDLVDNFNSIQVIEDFSERMRGLNPKGEPNQANNRSRKIKLYDYLKDTNQVIDKIEKLSRMKSLTIDAKIELFEKYLNDNNTDKTIIYDTLYEGYPIGMYLAQIRSELNNEEKASKYNQETINKLEELGLLDAKHESTIDEKIDRLIDFVQKYPTIWNLNKGKNIEKTISKYIEQIGEEKDKEELTRLLEIANNDYDYIRVRNAKGKISKEDIERLKEAGIGRVFGESQDLEMQKQVFIDKFGMDSKTYDLIIKQYGSIEGFQKMYIDSFINGKVEENIDSRILKKCNLVKAFDLSKPDLLCKENENYLELWKDVYQQNILIVNDINQIVDKTSDIFRYINDDRVQTLENFYGLNGHTKMTRKEMTEQEGVGRGTIGIKINRSLSQIRSRKHMINEHFIDLNIEEKYLKEFLEEYFNAYGVFVRKDDRELDEHNFKELRKNTIDNGLEIYKDKLEQIGILKKLPRLERKELYERVTGKELYGVNTDSMLMEILDNDLVQEKIRAFEKDRITNAVKDGINIFKMRIEELDLSVRAYNCLTRAGIETVEDLTHRSYEEVSRIWGLGKRSFYEIRAKLELKGLYLSSEKDDDYLEIIKLDRPEKISRMKEMVISSKYLSKEEKEELLEMIEKENPEEEHKDKKEQYKDKKEQIGILKKLPRPERNELYERVAGKELYGVNIDSMLMEILDNDLVQERIRAIEKDRITNAVKKDLNILKMEIEELDLSVRAYNCLKKAGINTLEDLTDKSYEEVSRIWSLGKKSFDEIIEKLALKGIYLSSEKNDDYLEIVKIDRREKIAGIKEMVISSKYLSKEEKEELLEMIKKDNPEEEQADESEKKTFISQEIGEAGFEVGIGDIEKSDEAQRVLDNLVEKTKEGGIKKDG